MPVFGVGQFVAAACRSPPPDSVRPSSCFRSADSAPPLIVRGVGHGDEIEAVSTVGRPDVGSGKQIPRRNIPELGQRSADVSKSVNNEGRDVLQEDDVGSNVAKDPLDAGPEPSLVVETQLLTGHTEGLTGESGSDAMNLATPRSAVKVVKVVPDRRLTKDPFFHSRDQISDDKRFPLHVADGGVGGTEDEVEREFQSTDAGTKSQAI